MVSSQALSQQHCVALTAMRFIVSHPRPCTIHTRHVQVARLAKQLPKGDVGAMAASLGVKSFTLNTDDVDTEDLT